MVACTGTERALADWLVTSNFIVPKMTIKMSPFCVPHFFSIPKHGRLRNCGMCRSTKNKERACLCPEAMAEATHCRLEDAVRLLQVRPTVVQMVSLLCGGEQKITNHAPDG